jgi:hypothetical protein
VIAIRKANCDREALDFERPQMQNNEIPMAALDRTALDSPCNILQWETAESAPGYVYQGEN